MTVSQAVPQAIPRAVEVRAVALEEGRWPRWRIFDRDPWLILSALALLGLGLVMVASTSISIAQRETGMPLYFFWRQCAYVGLGVGVAWGVSLIPLKIWKPLGMALILLGAVLLVLVLVPGVGREVNGSTRWLRLGIVNFQPSEMVKVFLVLYLSGYLVRHNGHVRHYLRGFVTPTAILAVFALLLLLEPDYGAVVVLFATALGMLFLGGVPWLGFLVWITAVAALLAVVVVLTPYRLERFLSFANPWADPFGSGFQLTQALIAIGRGEWFGVGLGAGVQKLFYLPEAHTDFMLAVLAEELGFAGVAVVIALFGCLFWRAMAIGVMCQRAGHFFASYLAYGLGLLIVLQAYINIGVNMGLLPTKGLTLPLMSYGGSSMLANCMAVGLLVRAEREARQGGQET